MSVHCGKAQRPVGCQGLVALDPVAYGAKHLPKRLRVHHRDDPADGVGPGLSLPYQALKPLGDAQLGLHGVEALSARDKHDERGQERGPSLDLRLVPGVGQSRQERAEIKDLVDVTDKAGEHQRFSSAFVLALSAASLSRPKPETCSSNAAASL